MINKKIGILGGGQLGRMLIQAGLDWALIFRVMDPDEQAPCHTIADEFVSLDYSDYDAVLEFGRQCDVLTIEFEHVNTKALKQLESEGVAVFPQPHILEIIKDKGLQKQFYLENEIPTASFRLVESLSEISVQELPVIQKTRSMGYDGKGVKLIRTEQDLKEGLPGPSVIEEAIQIKKELAVIVARSSTGEIKLYDPVEMVFNPEANLLDYLQAPAEISMSEEQQALSIAQRVGETLQHVGVLAVELFLTQSGDILVNEVAPRPHNSGHHTIEANLTSQYHQHLRAILGLSLGDTALTAPAVMVNLLGEKGFSGSTIYEGLEEALSVPDVFIHLYGKRTTKPFRKMGHVTILARSLDEARTHLSEVRKHVRVIA